MSIPPLTIADSGPNGRPLHESVDRRGDQWEYHETVMIKCFNMDPANQHSGHQVILQSNPFTMHVWKPAQGGGLGGCRKAE